MIDVPLGERLAVPEDAVLDTGTRQIVFVVRGEGDFEPRAVQLGREADGFREVLAGWRPARRWSSAQLPDRLRVALPCRRARVRRSPAARRPHPPAGAPALGRTMVERIIEFSARNRVLVLLLHGGGDPGRGVVRAAHPARRDPRSVRHPGHRLLALGPQPGHHRGPGHLSDRHRAARRAEGQGHPRLLRLRLLATSTSSSRTAPTSTGRARACSST